MRMWSWTVDDWYTAFQILTTVFIAVTVLTGAGAIIAGRVSSKRQSRALASANAEAAKANKGVVDAGVEIEKAKEGTALAVRDTTKAKEEIARLTAEAEEAKARAAEADKQIAIAKADAARAKEGIASAEARSLEASAEVSRFRVSLANAEKELADAQRERAQAQKALIELQQQIQDRHLRPDQRTALLALLKKGPKGTFSEHVAINREAQAFADELKSVLLEAGWTLGKLRQNMIGRATAGLGIIAAEDDNPRALHLFNSLVQVGVPVLNDVWPKEQPGTVILFVGEKPASK